MSAGLMVDAMRLRQLTFLCEQLLQLGDLLVVTPEEGHLPQLFLISAPDLTVSREILDLSHESNIGPCSACLVL